MTNPPPVKPVKGHYALLRNGDVMGPFKTTNQGFWIGVISDINIFWKPDGTAYGSDNHNNRMLKQQYDIIATISPADMQAAASGELERLKEALELAIAANAKMKDALSFYADDGPTPNVDGPWKATSWDFGAFARCTLADVANIEGGKNP